MKLRDKLDRIRNQFPKGPTSYGQIYKGVLEKKVFKRVTLYTLFVSDEGTHLLRPHIFQSEHSRNAKAWSIWFAANLRDIHIKAVLPGIGIRTSKSWAVKQILGWSAHVKHKSGNTRVAKRRHKTKSSGKQNGQVRVRSRQRNGKRKTK